MMKHNGVTKNFYWTTREALMLSSQWRKTRFVWYFCFQALFEQPFAAKHWEVIQQYMHQCTRFIFHLLIILGLGEIFPLSFHDAYLSVSWINLPDTFHGGLHSLVIEKLTRLNATFSIIISCSRTVYFLMFWACMHDSF